MFSPLFWRSPFRTLNITCQNFKEVWRSMVKACTVCTWRRRCERGGRGVGSDRKGRHRFFEWAGALTSRHSSLHPLREHIHHSVHCQMSSIRGFQRNSRLMSPYRSQRAYFFSFRVSFASISPRFRTSSLLHTPIAQVHTQFSPQGDPFDTYAQPRDVIGVRYYPNKRSPCEKKKNEPRAANTI